MPETITRPRQITVLIVEDHPVFARALEHILAAESDITVAGIGRSVDEAVELAGRLVPDIILMDYALAGGTGADATARILATLPDTAVILLTGSVGDEDLLRAAEAGIRGFVLKTASTDEIVEAVRLAAADQPLASAATLATLLRESIARREASEHAAQAADDRDTLVSDLARAIETDAITLEYQAKVHVRAAAVYGVEALARWRHPTRGAVPPGVFIPLAESAGLITRLTRSVLRQALRQRAEWKRSGLRLQVAVNVSTRDLEEPGFIEFVVNTLTETGSPPEALLLEITESDVMKQPASARATLLHLRARGISIAIDDFGTGYSSLAYLHTLPVTSVKIDRSFVLRAATDRSSAAIVRATIDLGHSLGLVVTAEGVEDQATFDRLVALGCDVIQGFLVCRPMVPERLDSWLRESRWSPTTAETAPPSLTAPTPRDDAAHVVLIVDDDERVLRGTGRILAEAGYIVLSAPTPAAALRIGGEHQGEIDLLLTDVVMPGMNGNALAQAIRADRPKTRVLLMSGFPRGLIDLAATDVGIHFLAKPFTERGLLRTIADLLGSTSPTVTASE